MQASSISFSIDAAQFHSGQCILVKIGNHYALIRLERCQYEVLEYGCRRFNRHTIVSTAIGDWFFADTDEKRERLRGRQVQEWQRHFMNIFGSQRLDLRYDEELDLHVPSSTHTDMYLLLGCEARDGSLTQRSDQVDITVGNEGILDALHEVARPQYLEQVITPFLEGGRTKFHLPRRATGVFGRIQRSMTKIRLKEVADRFLEKNFIYTGSKEEVYILQPNSSSRNSGLHFANRTLYEERGFVYPGVDNDRCTEHDILGSRPEVITRNVDEALRHFCQTDFAEFEGVFRRYAEVG